MEYIDFTQKRIELHEEMENAIRSLMKDKGIWEIDLTEDECWQPFDIQDTMAHPINQGENSLILYKFCTFAP